MNGKILVIKASSAKIYDTKSKQDMLFRKTDDARSFLMLIDALNNRDYNEIYFECRASSILCSNLLFQAQNTPIIPEIESVTNRTTYSSQPNLA